MCMSERDLPERLARYGGDHVTLKRIALTEDQLTGLPSFPASDKKTDKRYGWFVKNFGKRCWELDALDPHDLRARVKREIKKLIEPVAWRRCERINAAEQQSLKHVHVDGALMTVPIMSITERRRVTRMANKMHYATAGARTLFEVAAAASSVFIAALYRADAAQRARCVAYADKRLRSLRLKPPRPTRPPSTKRQAYGAPTSWSSNSGRRRRSGRRRS